MNRIEFRVEPEELGTGPAEVLNLYVDGSRLQDLIRPYERPFADAEGHSSLAGQYVGLVRLSLSARQFLGRPVATWYGAGDTAISRWLFTDQRIGNIELLAGTIERSLGRVGVLAETPARARTFRPRRPSP